MLRSSTQLAKSHGDYLGLQYLWNGDYVAVCSQTTDWLMYVMSEINDPSKEVKVRFMKKSGKYILLSQRLEKWFPKSAIFHRCSTPYYSLTIACVIPLMPSILKSTCNKIKTLDRGFKMDLHICKSQLK